METGVYGEEDRVAKYIVDLVDRVICESALLCFRLSLDRLLFGINVNIHFW